MRCTGSDGGERWRRYQQGYRKFSRQCIYYKYTNLKTCRSEMTTNAYFFALLLFFIINNRKKYSSNYTFRIQPPENPAHLLFERVHTIGIAQAPNETDSPMFHAEKIEFVRNKPRRSETSNAKSRNLCRIWQF
jgi:hypothetical protein